MRRDMELIQKTLLVLEEKDDFQKPVIPEIEGTTRNEIFYHIKFLNEAGLVDAQDWSTQDGPQ